MMGHKIANKLNKVMTSGISRELKLKTASDHKQVGQRELVQVQSWPSIRTVTIGKAAGCSKMSR
jgi:hypothetical protein